MLARQAERSYIAAMFIETEITPNPATLKFLPGQGVMTTGAREFTSPEQAEASPLAEAIFDTGEVTNVFFGGDFVSVTAAPGADWSALKPQVVAILLDHFISQAPLFASGGASGIAVPVEQDADDDPADAEIVAQIRELIETRVQPEYALWATFLADTNAGRSQRADTYLCQYKLTKLSGNDAGIQLWIGQFETSKHIKKSLLD